MYDSATTRLMSRRCGLFLPAVEATEAQSDGPVWVVLECPFHCRCEPPGSAGPVVHLQAGLAHLEVMVLWLPWLVLVMGQEGYPSLF